MTVKISIRQPIWKDRSVGIAKDKITEDIEVEILYKDKYGNRTFPGVYRMTKTLALAHPTQIVKGRELKIIPISEFKTEQPQVSPSSERKREKPVFGDSRTIHEMRWKK
jgi:hypothetical protein